MFYFPVNINARRLHVFHLKEKEASGTDYSSDFSFIVKNQDSPCLLSIDSDSPQLIASSGKNVDLHGYSFKVEQVESEEIPEYKINIVEEQPATDMDTECFLKSDGRMQQRDIHASVVIDSTLTDNIEEFIVRISYTDGQREYTDAVKIYLYKDDSELVSGALDFGSEASQIRFDGDDSNISIIDSFQTFVDKSDEKHDESGEKHDKSSEKHYWQGDPGDKLYKSSFFINLKPGTTKFGEKPKAGNSCAFVQPLLDRKAKIGDLELLPNLKLIEIGQGKINYSDTTVIFDKESNVGNGYLASIEFRESILRLILSNFLHCMLKRMCSGSRKKKLLLRMVIMVPNVYYQSKIYKLMCGLYDDYRVIQNGPDRYDMCRGFEVQVVSESDASFIGAKHNRTSISNATNGYFLIIDAGKGTTDFSILQQQKDFSKFSSLYRDGIPASGNVLTYAFFEAIHSYLMSRNIRLNNLIRSADKSELLEFVKLLESFKHTYSESDNNNDSFEPITSLDSLIRVNTYLENQLNEKKRIPHCKEFVDRKVALLTESLNISLNNYLSSQPKLKFTHVLLSGRGFLFEPFRQSVIKMLTDNNWMEHDAVIRIDGDEAKTLCLQGALCIEKECSVNCNSGLIGSPIISKTEDAKDIWDSLMKKFNWHRRKKTKRIDMDFFYQGFDKKSAQNVTITIGGRRYELSGGKKEDRSVFYVGNGFLCKTKTSAELIEEKTFRFNDKAIADLVLQSLFPFIPESIPDDLAMPKVQTSHRTTTVGKNTDAASQVDKKNTDAASQVDHKTISNDGIND